jgi:hypothetical protein
MQLLPFTLKHPPPRATDFPPAVTVACRYLPNRRGFFLREVLRLTDELSMSTVMFDRTLHEGSTPEKNCRGIQPAGDGVKLPRRRQVSLVTVVSASPEFPGNARVVDLAQPDASRSTTDAPRVKTRNQRSHAV